MASSEEFYPFRDDVEAVNNFRRIGRQVMSIAEGPIEVRIGKTSLFIFDPNRDLHDEVAINNYEDADYVVATAETLHGLPNGQNENGLMTLNKSNHLLLGREHDTANVLANDTYISRFHLLIDCNSFGAVTLHDLGSVNGTLARNLRINQGDWSNTTYYGESTSSNVWQEKRSSNPQIESSVASDKHPERNEDAVFTDEAHDSIGVLDGVGGSEEGGQASQVAAESIKTGLAILPRQVTKAFARFMMGEVLNDAHREVVGRAPGSQTTAAVAKFFQDEQGLPYATIAYAGDSRAYLLRNGKLDALTIDHAYMGSDTQMRPRDLQETLAGAESLQDLNDDELKIFRKRNIITSALGQSGTPTISFATVDLQPADILILTSDGVHDNLTTTEIHNVAANISFLNLTDELVAAAQNRSRQHHFRSKLDDITAAAVVFNG